MNTGTTTKRLPEGSGESKAGRFWREDIWKKGTAQNEGGFNEGWLKL